ncbi:HNH endonuclease [Phycicoccus endophyticus]|uniref:HNH endonuclease n=1 Tax=Phycicoccus endophyticus TaxID=1690220 RepID=A0A7G9R4H1_9MICO|nr:HNH endonuclease signature motif containing protein [Phycicoccus endophyticus]NHI18381.1 HNH endonuclease [Phycicoccus endophyticus]QNN50496.1 HNH endonuclease [Phycicoccus endophyticus]GGL24250.1 hypothetical protein GCM10012283_02940 [Phycicoccus endophyticus]
MAALCTPGDVAAAAHVAREAVAAVMEPASAVGSVGEWAEAVGELQSLANTVAAAQDAAVVRLAAIEPEVLDDGEVVETHRALGHVALDAAAVLSGVLTVSAVHAERRVQAAVRRAADGPDGTETCTGLGRLHAAMGAGRVDAYRAGVVAEELEECRAEVARAVLDALEPHVEREDGPRLRQRVRRVLAAISPDFLRAKAARARSESSLQRWVEQPGVDTWHGTFPSEEACAAWGAIDALAQTYVRDGVCERIDRARAKALTDLVTGNATVDVQVHLTTPAARAATTAEPRTGDERAAGDLVEVASARASEPVLVERGWLQRAVTEPWPAAGAHVTDAVTGALLDPHEELASHGYRPGSRLAALVRARDGHCRFPGCHVAARFCDLDHVTPWPAGPTSASNLTCLCRRHHRVKQRPGWRAVLHPDATMTWTDPTGRTRTTTPTDHARALVLPDRGDDPAPARRARGPQDQPHSVLEHHSEHHPPPGRYHLEYHHAHHRRRHAPLPTGPPPF